MTQLSKLKIILGLIYLLIVAFVTYLFFYYEIYNYVSSDFIKNDRKVIITFIEKNIFTYSFLFFSIKHPPKVEDLKDFLDKFFIKVFRLSDLGG